MRTYNVQVNDRTYTVSTEPVGNDRFRSTLDGELFETEALSDGNLSTWIVRSGEAGVRAACTIVQNGGADMWIAGLPFSSLVQVASPTCTSGLKPGGVEKPGGQIRALMPGRVTSVIVGEGEDVELGDPLLIFEAMKMLNEITSPFAGRVVRVHVREGETVKKDALLVVVE